MLTQAEIHSLMNDIQRLSHGDDNSEKDVSFWTNSAANIMIFLDDLIRKSENVNFWIPKSLNKKPQNFSMLELLFDIIGYVPDPNKPFGNQIWLSYLEDKAIDESEDGFGDINDQFSLYELIYSRCCLIISQMLSDRFAYVQKLLLKYVFSTDSAIRSLLASDLYVFIMRLINKQAKAAMCLLVMNMCKVAPNESLVNGVALINRIKHPFINFESPLYQGVLSRFQ